MSVQRLRDEEGLVLATAIILLLIMASIGLAVLTFTDVQQNQTRVERTREASFVLAEAAMQGQVFQLGRKWPGAADSAYPAECIAGPPGAPSTDPCPDRASLESAYGGVDYGDPGNCPAGTPTLPWTTSVRDNGITDPASGVSVPTTDVAYYDRALVDGRARYDANGDGKLWLRTRGVARCKVQAMVALVSQNLMPIPFPQNVITANWFQTGNNGAQKVIVDTRGPVAAEAADLALRCIAPLPASGCASYRSNQVFPDTRTEGQVTELRTVDDAQLASFRDQAKQQGVNHYFGPGQCPNLTGVTGGVVFAEETPAGCSPTGSFPEDKPGILVVAKGTLAFGGNGIFYGIVYAANLTNLSGAVVTIGGTATIQGAVIVDGPGGVVAGSSGDSGSGAANIVYDDRGFDNVKGHTGAGIVQNSWRVLPGGQ